MFATEEMRKKIPYNTKLPVKFTLAERDLIRNHTFYHPDFANLAMLEGKQIRSDMSLEDIEELQGYVAAEANHTPDSNLQTKLDRIFDKLQKFLDAYDDQE